MSAQVYAVWTRYVRPTGVVVRHAYGPFTLSRARTVRRQFLAAIKEDGFLDRAEVSVTRLIDTEAMNERPQEGTA